jgi:hypothetical protein
MLFFLKFFSVLFFSGEYHERIASNNAHTSSASGAQTSGQTSGERTRSIAFTMPQGGPWRLAYFSVARRSEPLAEVLAQVRASLPLLPVTHTHTHTHTHTMSECLYIYTYIYI